MSRTFTLEEATAQLPGLREILMEMRKKKPRIDELRRVILAMTRKATGNGHLVSRDVRNRQKEAREFIERLNELGEAIKEIGCELKGVEEGLIDFPSEREGRTVFLCWKLGEDTIAYWHELDTGFASRQPL